MGPPSSCSANRSPGDRKGRPYGKIGKGVRRAGSPRPTTTPHVILRPQAEESSRSPVSKRFFVAIAPQNDRGGGCGPGQNPPVTLRVTAPFDKGASPVRRNLKSLPCQREVARRSRDGGIPDDCRRFGCRESPSRRRFTGSIAGFRPEAKNHARSRFPKDSSSLSLLKMTGEVGANRGVFGGQSRPPLQFWADRGVHPYKKPPFPQGRLSGSAESACRRQNAQLPLRKTGTVFPSAVTASMDRSSVPIMKSTWIIESLMPRSRHSSRVYLP